VHRVANASRDRMGLADFPRRKMQEKQQRDYAEYGSSW
jgi:hypothetical protein